MISEMGFSIKIVVDPNKSGPKSEVCSFIQPASDAVKTIEFSFMPN